MSLTLLEQKNSLEEAAGPLVEQLVKRRDDGLDAAVRFQREESLHILDVFVSCNYSAGSCRIGDHTPPIRTLDQIN